VIAYELAGLLAGTACYAAGASLALYEVLAGRPRPRLVQACLLIGAVVIGVAIAIRWGRVGHGPFLDLYEILLSNLFSLGLLYGLAHWRFPGVRVGALPALGVIAVLSTWAVGVPREAGVLPATYENSWLWIHVIAGKLFLGACLVATSLAVVGLLPGAWREPMLRLHPGAADGFQGRVWRWLAAAFLCHSLMLVAGAVWAQDAWGRYWNWDPLETWAFATWVAMVAALHARIAFRIPESVGYGLVAGVFVLAFLTFFGVPYVSTAAHQGAL
jgi:ABC-type transport system involved in cytochrome c biogenesis permease subunit